MYRDAAVLETGLIQESLRLKPWRFLALGCKDQKPKVQRTRSETEHVLSIHSQKGLITEYVELRIKFGVN